MPKLINRKTNKSYFISEEGLAELSSHVLKAFIVEKPNEPEAVKGLKEKKLKNNHRYVETQNNLK